MRDYANKSFTPSNKKSGGNKNALSSVMLILAFVFAGFAVFHYIHEHVQLKNTATISSDKIIPIKTAIKKHVEKKEVHAAIHPKKSAPIKKVAADNQPRFDFYKLLPEMTVTIPTQDDATNNRAKPVTSSTPKTVSASAPGAYVLQIASLPKKSTAQQVQNTLQNAGYKTFIQPYQADHAMWYRVMIGPFNQLKTAALEQNKLAKHHTAALLLRVSK